MMNVKPVPAILILIMFTFILFVIDAGISESNKPEDDGIHILAYAGETYLDDPEPNEPEYKWHCSCGRGIREMSTYDCGDCGKIYSSVEVILRNIPTWPDYIELEKDLYIDLRHKNDPNYPGILWGSEIISKGTKIYFKE